MLPTLRRAACRLGLALIALLPVAAGAEPDLVECRRLDQDQLKTASASSLLALRCRARQISYDAPRLKGVSQRTKDDVMFACLDQADAIEHQLRVHHGYTREQLARETCKAAAHPMPSGG